MKKIKGCIPILISIILLSGCVKKDIKMTDEQIDRTAEYAAGVLLKYDKNYESTLSSEAAVLESNIQPESTTKSETELKYVNVESAKPENNNQTNGTDETNEIPQSEQLETKTLSKVINVKDCEVNFLKMQIIDNYQQNNSLYIKAEAGKKIVVLEFEVKNYSSSDKKVELLKKKILYTLQIEDGGEYQPDLAILVNDLQFYNEKIKKGKSKKAVLIFSVPKQEIKKTMKLQVVNGKQKAEVKIE